MIKLDQSWYKINEGGGMLLPQWALDKARSMSPHELKELMGSSHALSGALREGVTRIKLALSSATIPLKHKIALVAALVYVFAFWDVIPDFGPLGWLDDLAVVHTALSLTLSSGS